jgi:hypothetical protein
MKLRIFTAGICLLLAAAISFAHGDKKHVLGTIEKIAADSVWIKSTDGKSTEVKLVATTVYLSREGETYKPARASNLAVGDIVVIHATPKGETLEADEVKFSTPVAAAPK